MARPIVSLSAAVASAVLACGALAFIYYARPAGGVSVPRGIALVMFTAVACLAFAAIALTARTYNRYLQLKRGDGVIARWTVSANDWQAFVRNEIELSRARRASLNLVKYKNVNPDRDVDIVISSFSLLVGNDFHRLDSYRTDLKLPTLVASDPACVHFEVELSDPDDPFVRHALRFPAARESMAHVKDFIASYAQSAQPSSNISAR